MDAIQEFNPLLEIAVGTLGLVVIIAVHGIGVRGVMRRFSESWTHVSVTTPSWRVNLMFTMAIAGLATLHLFETLLWALPIRASGLIPSLRDSYYFVLETYTTLGTGEIELPPQWRLIGPIVAMSGLFTFGWTCSLLVSIMSDFGKFDRARADRGSPAPALDTSTDK